MDDISQVAFTPKMLALTERRRKFALAMLMGGNSAAEAARQAGYSDVKEGCKVRGHELMHDPDVIAAIEEAGSLTLRGLSPLAIGAARSILCNPKHKAHARMIEVVLDRVYPAKTEHKVSVEHKADLGELEALARRLAAEAGVNPERLLGNSAKTIEGQVMRDRSDRQGSGSDKTLPIGGNGSAATNRQVDRPAPVGGQADFDDGLPF